MSHDDQSTRDHAGHSSLDAGKSFAEAADETATPGLIADFWDFLKHNKKWWLTPILLALLLIGGLVLLSSSALAPFIYPLF